MKLDNPELDRAATARTAFSSFLHDADLFKFRTKLCGRKSRFGECGLEDSCPFSHCLSWSRRNPMKHTYRPQLCPNVKFEQVDGKMKVTSSCPRGRKCMFAHTKEEQMYHPQVYKTQLCNFYQQKGCDKYFCPFAHGIAEMKIRESSAFQMSTENCYSNSNENIVKGILDGNSGKNGLLVDADSTLYKGVPSFSTEDLSTFCNSDSFAYPFSGKNDSSFGSISNRSYELQNNQLQKLKNYGELKSGLVTKDWETLLNEHWRGSKHEEISLCDSGNNFSEKVNTKKNSTREQKNSIKSVFTSPPSSANNLQQSKNVNHNSGNCSTKGSRSCSVVSHTSMESTCVSPNEESPSSIRQMNALPLLKMSISSRYGVASNSAECLNQCNVNSKEEQIEAKKTSIIRFNDRIDTNDQVALNHNNFQIVDHANLQDMHDKGENCLSMEAANDATYHYTLNKGDCYDNTENNLNETDNNKIIAKISEIGPLLKALISMLEGITQLDGTDNLNNGMAARLSGNYDKMFFYKGTNEQLLPSVEATDFCNVSTTSKNDTIVGSFNAVQQCTVNNVTVCNEIASSSVLTSLDAAGSKVLQGTADALAVLKAWGRDK